MKQFKNEDDNEDKISNFFDIVNNFLCLHERQFIDDIHDYNCRHYSLYSRLLDYQERIEGYYNILELLISSISSDTSLIKLYMERADMIEDNEIEMILECEKKLKEDYIDLIDMFVRNRENAIDDLRNSLEEF